MVDLLPPSSLDFLQSYVLHPDSPFQSIRRALAATLAGLYPFVVLAADRITQAALNSPDIVLVVALLGIIIISIQILNWTRRVVVSLTRLVFNLVFYAVIVAILAFMYQRGLEASIRDAFVIGGRIWGYAQGVKDVFLREYERYVEEERLNKMRTSSSVPGGGAERGAPGGGYSGWR